MEKVHYTVLDDMKEITDIFDYDVLSELGEDEVHLLFATYYSGMIDAGQPVDLQAWCRVNIPKNTMRWYTSFGEQIVFVRDTISKVFIDNDKCYEYNESSNYDPNYIIPKASVCSTHTSKSIKLPVYRISLPEYHLEITMRENFHGWVVSIDSKYPIPDING